MKKCWYCNDLTGEIKDFSYREKPLKAVFQAHPHCVSKASHDEALVQTRNAPEAIP